MQWTDRMRQVKFLLVCAAVIICAASLTWTHYLVADLSLEERERMEVWAEAMRSLNQADANTDLNLVLKVLNDNNTIPVIVLDSHGNVTDFRNLSLAASSKQDSLRLAADEGRHLLALHRHIRVFLDEQHHDYIDVCYDESLMLKRLS